MEIWVVCLFSDDNPAHSLRDISGARPLVSEVVWWGVSCLELNRPYLQTYNNGERGGGEKGGGGS